MGYIFGFLIVALIVYLIFFRILWAITKPLFMYVYNGIVNLLKNIGLKEDAAKAVISLLAIIAIALILIK